MNRPAGVRKEIEAEGLEFGPVARYIDKLEAEVERLKGLKPDLPPYPSEPYDSNVWPRFGLRWNGPDKPLAVQMNDGYWTPYHIAKASADQRVIDAVAGARKAWAAQGCQEAKGHHAAEAIISLTGVMIGAYANGFVGSNTLTVEEMYQAARNHIRDHYGVEMPSIVEQFGD